MLTRGTCDVVAPWLTQPLSELQLEATQGAFELRDVPAAAGDQAGFPGAFAGWGLHVLAQDEAVST